MSRVLHCRSTAAVTRAAESTAEVKTVQRTAEAEATLLSVEKQQEEEKLAQVRHLVLP